MPWLRYAPDGKHVAFCKAKNPGRGPASHFFAKRELWIVVTHWSDFSTGVCLSIEQLTFHWQGLTRRPIH